MVGCDLLDISLTAVSITSLRSKVGLEGMPRRVGVHRLNRSFPLYKTRAAGHPARHRPFPLPPRPLPLPLPLPPARDKFPTAILPRRKGKRVREACFAAATADSRGSTRRAGLVPGATLRSVSCNLGGGGK